MSARTILLRAADLLAPPGRWMQGWFALDARGLWTTNPRHAVSLSADMALAVAAVGQEQTALDGAERALARVVAVAGVESDEVQIQGWNDAKGRTQAEVVAALRQAAEVAT